MKENCLDRVRSQVSLSCDLLTCRWFGSRNTSLIKANSILHQPYYIWFEPCVVIVYNVLFYALTVTLLWLLSRSGAYTKTPLLLLKLCVLARWAVCWQWGFQPQFCWKDSRTTPNLSLSLSLSLPFSHLPISFALCCLPSLPLSLTSLVLTWLSPFSSLDGTQLPITFYDHKTL